MGLPLRIRRYINIGWGINRQAWISVWANVTSAFSHFTVCPLFFVCWKHESFRVKVTTGSKRKSPELAGGGLLKDVVATSTVPVHLTLSRALSLSGRTYYVLMRNCLESAALNQFPFPGPKAPRSESDIWWLSKKCISGQGQVMEAASGLSCELHTDTQSFLNISYVLSCHIMIKGLRNMLTICVIQSQRCFP